jgi:Glycosyl transferases group 1
MQTYLPWLWQQGTLGGRSFDVLMTRLPLGVLQMQLDAAARAYPHSPTLGDFRADPALIAAETAALKAARKIITPHRAIAQLFPDKAVQLDWQFPKLTILPTAGEQILFPAATLGRKGAYELRQAAKALGLKQLTVLGRNFEGEQFWSALTPDLAIIPASPERLAGVGLVVLPAHVEHQPRLLLRALAAQIPVIATPACGLGEQQGLITVPTGDAEALAEAIAGVRG